jgi:hypothetical protein
MVELEGPVDRSMLGLDDGALGTEAGLGDTNDGGVEPPKLRLKEGPPGGPGVELGSRLGEPEGRAAGSV